MDDLNDTDDEIHPLDEASAFQQVSALIEIARKLRELSDFLDLLATTPITPQEPFSDHF